MLSDGNGDLLTSMHFLVVLMHYNTIMQFVH